MPSEPQHHTTKKKSYTVVLVPNDDAGGSKNYRFAPWQIITGFLLAAAFVVGSTISAIIYTPVGTYLPISNPELENKYNKELISLNQRMVSMMEELIEMRAYNVKMRRALGEPVVATDSGVVRVPDERRKQGDRSKQDDRMQAQSRKYAENLTNVFLQTGTSHSQSEAQPSVSFPAILPTEGYITQGFEPEHRHYGLDIAGKIGTPVIAAADGYAVFSGWTQEDGNLVILSHTGGFMTFYKHNETLLKPANVFVKRAEPIAMLGNSGRTSSGPHLHFEIWKDGSPVDPSLYILNMNF